MLITLDESSTNQNRRCALANDFIAGASEERVFILSAKAASVFTVFSVYTVLASVVLCAREYQCNKSA